MVGFKLRKRRPGCDDSEVIGCGWATNPGQRADNQDRVAVSCRWAMVSDGVGGQRGGARAAQLAVSTAAGVLGTRQGRLDERAVRLALARAGAAVHAGRQEHAGLAAMDATLTIAAATWVDAAASTWIVASVGDSPAWLVTGDGAKTLTTDHSLAADLVRSGVIRPEDASSHAGRHVLLRALATHEEPEPDLAQVTLEPGQGLVLASDGLIGPIGLTDVWQCWKNSDSAASAAERLVSASVEAGASDNVTVAVLQHSRT